MAEASYRQIAQQLNVSDGTAFADVQDELGRLDTLNSEKAERVPNGSRTIWTDGQAA